MEVIQGMSGWASKELGRYLKPSDRCWQPSDFLPDPSSDTFLDEVGHWHHGGGSACMHDGAHWLSLLSVEDGYFAAPITRLACRFLMICICLVWTTSLLALFMVDGNQDTFEQPVGDTGEKNDVF